MAIAGDSALDSESYVIFAVWCKSELVRKCKESLRTFEPDHIRICWVPRHSRMLGNEMVDALVRLGVRFLRAI